MKTYYADFNNPQLSEVEKQLADYYERLMKLDDLIHDERVRKELEQDFAQYFAEIKAKREKEINEFSQRPDRHTANPPEQAVVLTEFFKYLNDNGKIEEIFSKYGERFPELKNDINEKTVELGNRDKAVIEVAKDKYGSGAIVSPKNVLRDLKSNLKKAGLEGLKHAMFAAKMGAFVANPVGFVAGRALNKLKGTEAGRTLANRMGNLVEGAAQKVGINTKSKGWKIATAAAGIAATAVLLGSLDLEQGVSKIGEFMDTDYSEAFGLAGKAFDGLSESAAQAGQAIGNAASSIKEAGSSFVSDLGDKARFLAEKSSEFNSNFSSDVAGGVESANADADLFASVRGVAEDAQEFASVHLPNAFGFELEDAADNTPEPSLEGVNLDAFGEGLTDGEVHNQASVSSVSEGTDATTTEASSAEDSSTDSVDEENLVVDDEPVSLVSNFEEATSQTAHEVESEQFDAKPEFVGSEYVVNSGDVLSEVAKSLLPQGASTQEIYAATAYLAELNEINPNELSVGQTLNVPDADGLLQAAQEYNYRGVDPEMFASADSYVPLGATKDQVVAAFEQYTGSAGLSLEEQNALSMELVERLDGVKFGERFDQILSGIFGSSDIEALKTAAQGSQYYEPVDLQELQNNMPRTRLS